MSDFVLFFGVFLTAGAGEVPTVWYGIKVCQVVCDLTEAVYPGDEGGHVETAAISAATAVKDLRYSFYGNTCSGILVK